MTHHLPVARHRARGASLAATAALLLLAPATIGGTAFAVDSTAPTTPTDATPMVHNRAMDTVARMQPSWNMGNSLDAIPDETSWGNPPATKALFDYIKSQGFRSVRIPVAWSNGQSATAPYTIDPTYLARVKQVVDYALADGLYVDMNVHHDSWQWITNMPTQHDQVLARFDATWTQLAETFRNESDRLLFESVNEPGFTGATGDAQKMSLLDELNNSFHSIVRRSGGGNATRLLILPPVGSSPDQTSMEHLAADMATLNDPDLVATVHYYSFWPFSVNIAGYTTFNAQTQQDLTDAFNRMRDIFTSKGIPVYLGEYGLLSEPDSGIVERGEMLKYFQEVAYQARLDHVTTALWDDGNFLDRNALQWRDPALFSWIKSSYHTESGTASTDQVFVSKSGPVSAQTLTLNLNGTDFLSIWQDDTRLVRGRDYAVSGNQLTLTAAELAKLTGTGAYGVNSTLQVHFSRGLPWQIQVITNDTPALSGATGTSDSLAIPTQFHGDRIATMEASYADGTGAGPASWTTYQEFGTAFSPDYTGGALTLTSAFLTSLKDGAPVTLTFHFWSGTSDTYHLTKSGTSVTGTSS
ncbi:cellulase family glycosylhydrolase [Streptacidiphilus jiangxiensis]|uniref:Aryl-phospho-beta-D-glucosidase BglC, GH1 family n=1 Tax=Streptacidiphilus jiangxiensis TaxID=235985 RepID=A0A1H7Z0W3_STRJI|nr:cellulase family glycosylhydrolase [Streptacidiphilus jiangxiensis]SEM52182.1 Aryl-phospho-beta-D-glucosidase BglC, GH1 family [Streptacidiphilus jiangxiensis]